MNSDINLNSNVVGNNDDDNNESEEDSFVVDDDNEDGDDFKSGKKRKKYAKKKKSEIQKRKLRTIKKKKKNDDDGEAEEVDDAVAQQEGGKPSPYKITPLKKLVIKPDIGADEIFEGSFLPLAVEGEYTIGIMFVVAIVIQDALMYNSLLGYEKDIPVGALTHTCEKETIFQTFARIAEKKRNLTRQQKRELINTTRERQKVERSARELQPRILKMFFALHQADKSKTPFSLDELRCPELVYRVKLRMMPGQFDEFGTFNFHRALRNPYVEFSKLQDAMECAIPITILETYRYCYLDSSQQRGCLSGIPLLHNCAARFEFVSLAACEKTEYSMNYDETYLASIYVNVNRKENADAQFERDMRAAEEEEANRIRNGVQEENDEDAEKDEDDEDDEEDDENKSETDDILATAYKKKKRMFTGASEETDQSQSRSEFLLGAKEERGHNDDDDEDHDDKFPDKMKLDNADDDFDKDVSDLFAAALGDAPPPGMIDEKQKLANMNREAELSKKDIARLHAVHAFSEEEAERLVEFSEAFEKLKRSMVVRQASFSDFYRPLSARLIMWSANTARLGYLKKTTQTLLSGPVPEINLYRRVLKAFSLAMFTVMPRYVVAWSKELKVSNPQFGMASSISVDDARVAIEQFAKQGNKMTPHDVKTPIATSLQETCLCGLGENYPLALGFMVARNASAVNDFNATSVTALCGVPVAHLPFGLYKNLPEPSENMPLMDDSQTVTIRRYWSALLPEQFWRVAVVIGFRGAMHFLRLGAIDSVLQELSGDAPHMAIFSRLLFAFQMPSPKTEMFSRGHAIVEPKAKRGRTSSSGRASSLDKTVAAVPFRNTVHSYKGVSHEFVRVRKVVNSFPSLLSRLPSNERRRLLSGIAQMLADRSDRFSVEHYIDLFEGVLIINKNIEIPKQYFDTVVLSPFLLRDREDLALFYPQQPNCWYAVSECYDANDDAKVRENLFKLDAQFKIDTKNEPWAHDDAPRPVSSTFVQSARKHDMNRSLINCLTGEAFERFGVDTVRCDTLDHIYLYLIERLEYILLRDGYENVRFHMIVFPDADLATHFDRYLTTHLEKHPNDLWDYAILIPKLHVTYRHYEFVRESMAKKLGEKFNPASMKRKAYFYFPRCDIMTHEELQSILLNTTNDAMQHLTKKDWSMQDLSNSFLPAEETLFNAFMRPPVTIDADTLLTMSDSIERGVCGDYLYLSGLAMHRGTFLGTQIAGPSVFEDIFFACNAGDCCTAPPLGNVEEFGQQGNKTARLRSWSSNQLQHRLVPMTENEVILEAGVPGEREIKIKFVSSRRADKAELVKAAQLGIDFVFPSPETPANIWFDTDAKFACGIDGVTRKSDFGILRSREFDLVLMRRIGLDDVNMLRESARLLRFLFADLVRDSDIIRVDDSEAESVACVSCNYENMLVEEAERRQTKKTERATSAAAMATPLSIEEARSKAIGAPSLAQMSSALRRTETNWLEQRADVGNGGGSSTSRALVEEENLALLEPSLTDLRIQVGAMRKSILRNPPPRTRREALFNLMETWESLLAARMMPTRGFSIRELIAAAADPPDEIVIMGTWKDTKRRLFGTPILPDYTLLTESETHRVVQRDLVSGALDFYALNFITSLPYMANTLLSGNAAAQVKSIIIAPAAHEKKKN